MTHPIQPPVLADLDAERFSLACILREPFRIDDSTATAEDYYQRNNQVIIATMREVWNEPSPINPLRIANALAQKGQLLDALPEEFNKKIGASELKANVLDHLEKLKTLDVEPSHIGYYDGIIRERAAARRTAIKLAEALKQLYALAPMPQVTATIQESIMLSSGGQQSHVVTWHESIDRFEALLNERERRAGLPPEQRKIVNFPWEIWNKYILALTPGTGLMVAAPPNTGKTIFLEEIAEHQARSGLQVAFFQFELDEEDMGERRTSRWTGVHRPVLQGQMSEAYREHIRDTGTALKGWNGGVNYVYCPGWTAEKLTAEALAMCNAGLCDVLIIDYHQKIQPTEGQKRFYRDEYKVEANNMEIIKTFAQRQRIPYIVASQMTKEAHDLNIKEVSNRSIRGAGELSEKVNIVLIALPEVVDGRYTGIVNVKITKNKGPKLMFRQRMIGPLYMMDRNWADDPEPPPSN